MNKKTRNILIVIVVLLLLWVIGKCNSKSESASNIETNATKSSQAEEPKKVENWKYSDDKDEMTDKIVYHALCTSKNTIDFDFPYAGGSQLRIDLRNMDGENEVILIISKGQFMPSLNNNVKIKFDNQEIVSYGYDNAADGSSEYIFLNPTKSILEKIKSSSKIKIQPQFYQEGQTVFEFDVDGLKWDR